LNVGWKRTTNVQRGQGREFTLKVLAGGKARQHPGSAMGASGLLSFVSSAVVDPREHVGIKHVRATGHRHRWLRSWGLPFATIAPFSAHRAFSAAALQFPESK